MEHAALGLDRVLSAPERDDPHDSHLTLNLVLLARNSYFVNQQTPGSGGQLG